MCTLVPQIHFYLYHRTADGDGEHAGLEIPFLLVQNSKSRMTLWSLIFSNFKKIGFARLHVIVILFLNEGIIDKSNFQRILGRVTNY